MSNSLRDSLEMRGYMPVSDVAVALGMAADTIRRWCRKGSVEFERVGKGGRDSPSIYVDAASVASYVGGAAERLLNVKPFELSDPSVYKFATIAEVDAFIEGCQRYAPEGIAYRIQEIGAWKLVKIITREPING